MCDRGEGKADLHTDDGTICKQSCFSVRGILVRQTLLESHLRENRLICTTVQLSEHFVVCFSVQKSDTGLHPLII